MAGFGNSGVEELEEPIAIECTKTPALTEKGQGRHWRFRMYKDSSG
jgi:hypothetical protein